MFHINKFGCFQLTPRLKILVNVYFQTFFLLDFHCLTYSEIGEWDDCALVCSLQSRQLSKQRSSEVVLWVVLVGVVCGWWGEHCKIENEPTS